MANFLNFKKESKYYANVEQHNELDGRSKLLAKFDIGPSLTNSPTQLGLALDKATKGSIKPMMLDGKLGLVVTPYRKTATARTKGTARLMYKAGHLEVWHNRKGIRITMNFPRTWCAEDVINSIDDEVFDLCHIYPELLQYTEEKAPDNSQEDDYLQHFDPDV